MIEYGNGTKENFTLIKEFHWMKLLALMYIYNSCQMKEVSHFTMQVNLGNMQPFLIFAVYQVCVFVYTSLSHVTYIITYHCQLLQ